MSDWQDATDPVPPRRELSEAEKRRRQAYLDYRRQKGLAPTRAQKAIGGWLVDADFDEMGA